MDNRTLNYLALARKAGLAELGEEPVGAAARAGKAHLILVAGDASEHTWRRAKSFAAGTDQQVLRLAVTKEEMGFVIGRTSLAIEMGFVIGRTSLAIAAITDASLALALVDTLEKPDPQVRQVLADKALKARKHRQEAKAHQRNLRRGKKK